QRRGDYGPNTRGYHELQPGRDGDQPAVHQNVGSAPGIIRADQLIGDAQLRAQASGFWLGGKERIRAGFKDKAVVALRPDHATQASGLLKQSPLKIRAGLPGLLQIEGSTEPSDPATDDGYALHASETIPEARASRVEASRASAATNVSEA